MPFSRLSHADIAAEAVSRGIVGSISQIEIYFSVVQRKVLTPNELTSLAELEERLMAFQTYYQKVATPFEWKFTKHDLRRLLAKLDNEQVKHLKVA